MEKYGVQEDDMICGLRNEEHMLMTKVAGYMGLMEKNGAQEHDMRMTEIQLHAVRDKITEHDLKKTR